MPRLIFKCPYLKAGGSSAAHLNNYVRYMATRDGAERIMGRESDQPATPKQQELAERLANDFPLSRGLFEYADYQAAPTQANASEFISRALEDNLDQLGKRENYVDYIAMRPRAQRRGAHALFSASDDPLVLSQISEAVAHHPGSVWLPILSLRREDAARLGYDNAQRWRELLTGYAPKLAEAMKIPLEQLRWYAAFHDEGHHPHVHMVVYSADGKSGYLSRAGIAAIRRDLAGEIFRQELTELYQEQTQRRDDLTTQAKERVAQLVQEMKTGKSGNPNIERLMLHLARQLQSVKGKKQYGYLKAPLKNVVDQIVDELARDPRVAEAYSLWYEMREEVLRTYKNDLPERVPLSKQKEFKQIRNMVIREAAELGGLLAEPEGFPQTDNEDRQEKLTVEQLAAEAEAGNIHAQYELGRRCWNGDGMEQDRLRAVIWLTQAAERGNSYAAYALGKIYLEGRETPKNIHKAVRYLTDSAEQDNHYAQYQLGKLYLLGEDTKRDQKAAIRWFTQSARQGNERAQWFLDHRNEFKGPAPFQCAVRLLHHLSQIFEEQVPQPALRVEVDQKLRRRIQEKKIAMGHKADDHEEPVQGQKM